MKERVSGLAKPEKGPRKEAESALGQEAVSEQGRGSHTVFPGTANGKRQRSAVCKEIHKTAVFCAVGVGVLSSRSHQIAKAEKVGDTGRAYLPTYVPVEPNDYLQTKQSAGVDASFHCCNYCLIFLSKHILSSLNMHLPNVVSLLDREKKKICGLIRWTVT